MAESKHSKATEKKKKSKAGRIILFLLAAVIIAGGALTYLVLKHPGVFFRTGGTVESADSASGTVSAAVSSAIDTGAAEIYVSPSATPAVEEAAAEPEDDSPEIINILLCGIDAFEQGGTTSGTVPHTDAMMVISVNLTENRVDVTSILRDTFASAPGLFGMYKMNSVFNAGGGMSDIASGLDATRRMAERWMGGIEIPYYYALDFQAVVDIVDAIGGIDYDVDTVFQDALYTGRWYYKGMQHLNGSAVLGYIRIRTQDDGLDSTRTARQRKMVVALFNKIKDENLLSTIPALINSASSGIYTNTNILQTTALANYAVNVDQSKIYTHSLEADLTYNYIWKVQFVHMDQRAELLKEIYGIDAEPIKENSPFYERFWYNEGIYDIKYYTVAEKIISYVNELVEGGYEMSEEETEYYSKCYNAYVDMLNQYNKLSDWAKEQYLQGQVLDSDELEAEYKSMLNDGSALRLALREAANNLNWKFGSPMYLRWSIDTLWNEDPDINETPVDFG